MKKTYLILVLTVIVKTLSFAQWSANGNNISNTNTGNVGINTTAPISRLSVYSGTTAPSTRDLSNSITIGVAGANTSNKYLGQFGFSSHDSNFSVPKIVAFIGAEAAEQYIGDNNSGTAMRFFTTSKGAGSPTERIVISSAGNLGIGTPSPSTLLHTKGSAATPITMERTYTNGNVNILYKDDTHSIYAGMNANGGFSIGQEANLLASALFTVQSGGNVGIGTGSPTDKLSVKGKIRAQEIKVELTGWSDFVFARDYKLPALEETEKHINETGHLPGIPSAAEVAKNGIELGEMNKKLLQKIEELTLYLIEQNKSIKTLKDQNEVLTSEVGMLKNSSKGIKVTPENPEQ